jgi:hypothetical protein
VKLRSAKLWITVVSLMAVSLFAIVDTRRASPGPISSVHGKVEDLQGRGGCSECHGGWFSTMTESCKACHVLITEQITDRKGLHGHLDAVVADRCANCHSEHHGETFEIVNDKSFRGTGATTEREFKHDQIGWHMDGRHLEIGCVDCHRHADDKVLAEGTVRFLGLAQDCGSCHEDPHEGRMQVACAACHGQTQWNDLHSVGHEKFLPLVGGHGDLSCRECHAETDPHSLESMGMKGPRQTQRDCVACHESPHTQGFASDVARLAVMPLGQSCVTCHAAEHKSFREPGLTITPKQHSRSGFPVDAPHDKATCAQCHVPELDTFKARYPGRSPEACSICHADPHGGQFEGGPFGAQQCTVCHDRMHFEPHAFTLEKHAQTTLPLDGHHAKTDCNECHLIPDPAPGTAEAPRMFRGTPSDCDACHRDAHAGFFDDVVTADNSPAHGQCAACHTTESFAQIPEAGFDHAQFTGFPVLGAHAQSECSSCHPSMPVADDSGRTFGRVEQHFGEFRGCITCHRDPHGAQFDGPGMPAIVEGRTDCARCHDETSFRSFPKGFDHGQWTKFSLVGAHDQDCSVCHEPLRRPDSVGRTWKRAAGASCNACHIDPHAGQFDLEPRKSCDKCHDDSAEPDFVSFNHDRDSLFPLREQHENLDCAKCHKPWTDPEGFEVVRYRPLGRECVDCHGVNEDALLHRRRRNK